MRFLTCIILAWLILLKIMTHKNCRTIKRQFIFAFLTIPPAIMLLYLKVHNLNDINYTTSSLSIQQYRLALFVKHFLQISFHRNTQLREHRVSKTVSRSTRPIHHQPKHVHQSAMSHCFWGAIILFKTESHHQSGHTIQGLHAAPGRFNWTAFDTLHSRISSWHWKSPGHSPHPPKAFPLAEQEAFDRPCTSTSLVAKF